MAATSKPRLLSPPKATERPLSASLLGAGTSVEEHDMESILRFSVTLDNADSPHPRIGANRSLSVKRDFVSVELVCPGSEVGGVRVGIERECPVTLEPEECRIADCTPKAEELRPARGLPLDLGRRRCRGRAWNRACRLGLRLVRLRSGLAELGAKRIHARDKK